MPKVSEQHREQRRQQILDGARACFARHGYERTTVRQLEAEIGLSMGAIFNYYPSKLDLFIALATQDGEQMARMWMDGGLPGLIHAMRERASELSASYLELGRRVWSDPEFRVKWAQRGAALSAAIDQSLATAVAEGRVRADVPLDELAEFAIVVLDGLLLRIRAGLETEHLDGILRLYDEALRGGQKC